MEKLKTIIENGSKKSPDKDFKKLHEFINDTLDENLLILDSDKTGAQKNVTR